MFETGYEPVPAGDLTHPLDSEESNQRLNLLRSYWFEARAAHAENRNQQAIDEDFLQWFVKNPSCESVEIENNWEFLGDDYRRGGERTLVYKIIIPKEESLNNTKEETLEGVVLSNGYNKQGYGYRKIMGNNTHWITLFISGGFQMYAYYTDDEEMEKIYDTGVVEKITPKELEVLIRVLVID
jgi:hypothetical protein